jgi:flagellar biosynthesis protein FliR
MHVEAPVALVFSFLSVWARVAGMFTFLPVPGLKSPFDPPRIFLGLLITIGLAPKWPETNSAAMTPSGLAALVIQEAAFGLCCGLSVLFVLEVFQFAAQVLAQQAGFSYASTIDPTNDTDSGVLLIICQLLCGWLSIAAGLDRQLITLIASSLDHVPPGSFNPAWANFEELSRLAGHIFSTGLRLALPAVAVFLVLDVLLAILSRLEQQLQLTSILFPAKTAGALLAATYVIAAFPGTLESLLRDCFRVLRATAGG